MEFKELPWSRAIYYRQNGQLDYLTNLTKTDERSDYTYWIGPLRKDMIQLIVNKENVSLEINNLDDLVTVCQKHGKRFSYQDGVFYSDKFKERIENDADFKECFIKSYEMLNNFKMTEQSTHP